MKKNLPTTKSRLAHERHAQVFCICALAFMLVQWVVFYVYGNINNILLAFQRFDAQTGTQVFYDAPNMFKNFTDFFSDLFSGQNLTSYFLNGVIMHLVTLVALPVSIMFSFIIYKKLPLKGLFKVGLYLPTIISSMVVALFFRYFVEYGLAGMWRTLFGADLPTLIMDPYNAFPTMLVYCFFTSVPGSLLLNLGTMSRIPDDLVEVGQIEGFSLWQEFIHLTVPMMFPILQVYCLGIFTGFFTQQGPLFAIYGNGAGIKAPEGTITFGYYMTLQVIGDNGGGDNRFMYGYTTAANLTIGLVSIPIIWGTKKLFDRFDPEAEF